MSHMVLVPLGDAYESTRKALHLVGVHIVARARIVAVARFGLRVTPGGFGTPEFGDGPSRVRVAGSTLVVESGAAGGASSRRMAMDGATLQDIADFAGLDLTIPIDVGHDTMPLPDPTAALRFDDQAAAAIGAWYDLTSRALDRVGAALGESAAPSLIQLWPEHFDVAFDVAYGDTDPTSLRANLGGSPGDDYEEQPYAYVGPWNASRPGDSAFWNAPFGAVLRREDLAASDDPLRALTMFFLEGVALLRG